MLAMLGQHSDHSPAESRSNAFEAAVQAAYGAALVAQQLFDETINVNAQIRAVQVILGKAGEIGQSLDDTPAFGTGSRPLLSSRARVYSVDAESLCLFEEVAQAVCGCALSCDYQAVAAKVGRNRM